MLLQLLNSYRSFASDTERQGLSSNLQQTEEWLYDEGDDESEHVYSQKLEDLKQVLFIIFSGAQFFSSPQLLTFISSSC